VLNILNYNHKKGITRIYEKYRKNYTTFLRTTLSRILLGRMLLS